MFSVPMSAVNMFHDTSFHGTYRHVVVHTPTPSFQVERSEGGGGDERVWEGRFYVRRVETVSVVLAKARCY